MEKNHLISIVSRAIQICWILYSASLAIWMGQNIYLKYGVYGIEGLSTKPLGYLTYLISEVIMDIICLIGLYGLSFDKAVFIMRFWRCFAIFAFALLMWEYYQNIIFIEGIHPDSFNLGKELLDIIVYEWFVFPLYIGLFIYGFCKNNIWEDKRGQATFRG